MPVAQDADLAILSIPHDSPQRTGADPRIGYADASNEQIDTAPAADRLCLDDFRAERRLALRRGILCFEHVNVERTDLLGRAAAQIERLVFANFVAVLFALEVYPDRQIVRYSTAANPVAHINGGDTITLEPVLANLV